MNKKLNSLLIGILLILFIGAVGWVFDQLRGYLLPDSNTANEIETVEAGPTQSAQPDSTVVLSTLAALITPTPTPMQADTAAITGYGGPVLPSDNLSGNNLFTDGIAVVKLDFGIDGDTAAFIVGGKSYHVRMLAIDTPEVDENLRQLDPWGKAASSYTKKVLSNASAIVLELDPDSDVFDKYGRLLAWVWVDGELHNYNIVEAGLAKVAYLYGDYLYTGELQNAQADAKAQGIKIWGEKDPDYDY